MKAWTVKAILQAHAGAEKLTEQGYTAFPLGYQDFHMVTTPEGMIYRVSPSRPTCNCKQCVAEGICKHIVWVSNLINDESELNAEIDYLESIWMPPCDACQFEGED